ncbi:MAG: hypothetical protein RI940_787 [Bacteroidota bacterium]|jgi:hypothetical protein
MFKKIILILVICILTIQTFPTEWLSSMLNKTNCIELVSTSNADEDADEDVLKNLKFKLIEIDILNYSRKNLIYTKKVYFNYIDLVFYSFSNEVICPPPNYI